MFVLVMLFVPFFIIVTVALFVLLRDAYFRVCSYRLVVPAGLNGKAKARIYKLYFQRRNIVVEGPPDVGVPWHLSLGRPPYRLFVVFSTFDRTMAETFWSDIKKWEPTLKGHLFVVIGTPPLPNAGLLHARHFGIPFFLPSELPKIRDLFSSPPPSLHSRILAIWEAANDVAPQASAPPVQRHPLGAGPA